MKAFAWHGACVTPLCCSSL